jgi:GNAT superfamily N-acetyltransferase
MIPKDKDQDLHFGLAASEDAVEMVDFQNKHHGTKRNPEHWFWEWQTNIPDKSVLATMRRNRELIATFGVIPLVMSIDGRNILAGKTESMLLIPEYRGHGIATKIYKYVESECLKKGFQLIWGFTYEREAKIVFRMLGYTFAPTLAVAGRPGSLQLELISRMNTRAPLWIRLGSAGKLVAAAALFRRRRGIPKITEQPGYELKEDKCNEVDLQSLYERLQSKNKYLISIKLDAKYLSWRVRENPFLKYDEYQVYQDGQMRAYAFVTLVDGKATISDLTSEDNYATCLLLDVIIKRYQKRAGRFTFMCNPKDYLAQDTLAQLQKYGFKLNSNPMELLYKDLTRSKDGQDLGIQNWHICGLWTEGFSM